MENSRKKCLVAGFLFLLWLPFLLLTDLYPFLRFGMFAEPIRPTSQETFVLYAQKNKKLEKYNTYWWGLDESVFNYLARKYYYQKRLEYFGENLCKAHKNLYPQSPQKWFLYREVAQKGKVQKELIATYEAYP